MIIKHRFLFVVACDDQFYRRIFLNTHFAANILFHRPMATQETEDMESLCLPQNRRFHIRQLCANPDEVWRTIEYRFCPFCHSERCSDQ